MYDWSEEGEAEVVVEDICRVNLDNHTKYDAKLQDWLFDNEWEWKAKRIMWVILSHRNVCFVLVCELFTAYYGYLCVLPVIYI